MWRYANAAEIFKEALDARQADVFRQSITCYSGFVAPKALVMATDEKAKDAFHENVARLRQGRRCHSDLQAVAAELADRRGRRSIPDQRPQQPPARDHRLRASQRTGGPGSGPRRVLPHYLRAGQRPPGSAVQGDRRARGVGAYRCGLSAAVSLLGREDPAQAVRLPKPHGAAQLRPLRRKRRLGQGGRARLLGLKPPLAITARYW